ncbi:hypothetical protein [Fodinicola acaciae]|uniref:hypothetical protein n=1 Tax=Fodinicola acaciae TaxID=2681555 RepID=UPI0013D81075|nr:hypothetical protein [Fodinicola acaciae]
MAKRRLALRGFGAFVAAALVVGLFPAAASAATPAPTVWSAEYPDDDASHGGVGIAGNFTFGANGVADVAAYYYSFGGSCEPLNMQRVDADSTGGATVTYAPTSAGQNTLCVRSTSPSGLSDPALHRYNVSSPGTVQLTFTDSTTGAPITDMCARVAEIERCGSANGVILLEDVPSGSYTASVYSQHRTHWGQDLEILVQSHQVTEKAVVLAPAAAIATMALDARTGKPLADVCVSELTLPMRSLYSEGGGYCSGANGRIVIGPVAAGTYVFMATSGNTAYGLQWVGVRGGTGDVRLARTVTATTGRLVSMPPVRMDLAGAITGQVTDVATGAAVGGVCAYPYARHPANLGFGPNCSNSTGTYTISGLGPYKWPVQFTSRPHKYATQWSGGAADRLAATPVQVTSGKTVTADAKMAAGGSVTGRVLDTAGQPTFGYVEAYNARSGDLLLSTSTPPDRTGTYAIAGLATQDLKIVSNVEGSALCWYQRASDFDTATVVHSTAGQAVDGIDLARC